VEALVEIMPSLLAQAEDMRKKESGRVTTEDLSARLDDLEKIIFAIAQNLGLPPSALGLAPEETPVMDATGGQPPPQGDIAEAGLTPEALAAAGMMGGDPSVQAPIAEGPGMPGPTPATPPGMPQQGGMQVMASERRLRPANRIRSLLSNLRNAQ
jgi:hypothetical protein